MEPDLPVLKAIAGAVARELERRGAVGSVTVIKREVALQQGAQVRRTQLGTLARDWPTLHESLRQQRVQQLCLLLVPAPSKWNVGGAVLALTIAFSALSVMAFRAPALPDHHLGEADLALAVSDERVERQKRVCEAGVSRAMRGGTLSPAESEGWVVELSIVHRSKQVAPSNLSLAPYLRRVDQNRAFLTDAPVSAALGSRSQSSTTPDVELLEQTLDPLAAEDGALGYLRLTFTAEHAASYFDPERRIQWVRLAHDLAGSLRATHAALYARCEHQNSHHIGGWFYGASASHAAGSLIWSMIGSSKVPLLKAELLPGPFDEPRVLLSILSAVRREAARRALDKRALALLIAADGGYVEGPAEGALAVHFPLRDNNRAARTAMRMARELELVRTR